MKTTTEQRSPSYWAELGDCYDCTGHIGPFKSDAAWPMYSFDRPAYIFWNTIAAELNKAGWTDDQIKNWLQSKAPRWALDGDWTEQIEHFARELAKDVRRHYCPI